MTCCEPQTATVKMLTPEAMNVWSPVTTRPLPSALSLLKSGRRDSSDKIPQDNTL